MVLRQRPSSLWIEVQTGTRKMMEVNGKRIFELRVIAKQWTVDHASLVKVLRYGVPIVADFGGTAHAYCGGTLDAEIGDLLRWDHKPRRDDGTTRRVSACLYIGWTSKEALYCFS